MPSLAIVFGLSVHPSRFVNVLYRTNPLVGILPDLQLGAVGDKDELFIF